MLTPGKRTQKSIKSPDYYLNKSSANSRSTRTFKSIIRLLL